MSNRSHGSSSRRDRDWDRRDRGARKERESDRSRDRERLRGGDDGGKMVDLRAKIREGLSQADTLSQMRSGETNMMATTSIREDAVDRHSLSRIRQIEAIDSEESGFRPQQFKSSAGGAGGRVYGNKKQQPSKAEKAIKKEDAHEQSIFGPSKPQTLDDISLPKDATKEGNDGNPLLHPSLSEDPDARKERWMKLWTQRRRELGIG